MRTFGQTLSEGKGEDPSQDLSPFPGKKHLPYLNCTRGAFNFVSCFWGSVQFTTGFHDCLNELIPAGCISDRNIRLEDEADIPGCRCHCSR